jgi:hypothetical protein
MARVGNLLSGTLAGGDAVIVLWANMVAETPEVAGKGGKAGTDDAEFDLENCPDARGRCRICFGFELVM